MDSQFFISICGNKVSNFLSTTNEIISFTIPKGLISCNSSNSVLNVNGASEIITGFSYDDTLVPVVTGLSINSASPILKTNLVITGSMFSDMNKTKVFLLDEN